MEPSLPWSFGGRYLNIPIFYFTGPYLKPVFSVVPKKYVQGVISGYLMLRN